MFFGPRLGQLKRELEDAVYTNAGKDRLLQHKFTISPWEGLAAYAGILTLGVFAHDVKVNLTGCPRAAVTSHHWRNDAGHQACGAQVDVLVELAAEQQ